MEGRWTDKDTKFVSSQLLKTQPISKDIIKTDASLLNGDLGYHHILYTLERSKEKVTKKKKKMSSISSNLESRFK